MNKVLAFEIQQAVKRVCKEGVGAPDVAVVTLVLTFLWSLHAEDGVDADELFQLLVQLENGSDLKGGEIVVELFTMLPDEAISQIKKALNLTTAENLTWLFNKFDELDYCAEVNEELFELAVKVVLELNVSYTRRQPSTRFVRDFIWKILDPKGSEIVTDLGGVLADLFKKTSSEKRDFQYLKPQNWFERMVSMLTARYYSQGGGVEAIEIMDWPNKKFDVVLANPVFEGTIENTSYEVLKEFSNYRHNNLLTLFIDIALGSLSDSGRAVIVVPEGFLNSLADKKFRAILLDEYHLQAVIQLPEGSLSPIKKVSGSLLYFDKRSLQKSIRFVDFKSTSFIQEKFEENLEVVLTSEGDTDLSFLNDIFLDDVYAKDCDLTPKKYMKAQVQCEVSSNMLSKRILELESELKDCNSHIELLLEELKGISV